MDWQLQLLIGPHVVEGAASQNKLSSTWPDSALPGLAHDAIEEKALLVVLRKIPDMLRANMVVVNTMTRVTTQPAEAVTIDIFLLVSLHLVMVDMPRVVDRPGLTTLGPSRAAGLGSRVGLYWPGLTALVASVVIGLRAMHWPSLGTMVA